MSRRRKISLILAGMVVLLAFTLAFAVARVNVFAQTGSGAAPQPTKLPVQKSIGNDTCLSCHGKPGLVLPLENGQNLDLYVNPDDYAHSIHGEQGYACVQCHTTVGNYPHPPFSAKDVRDASLQLYPACERCHSSQYTLTQDSVHAAALESGNRNAAICTDCHTAHTVRRLTDPQTGDLLPDVRTWIPKTCAQCHSVIYQKYRDSVHGSALVGEGNSDVPTCIDCHGVHNIENPTTASFRLKSPEICAKCHTDPKIMDKYGISTQVLNTYVADFHGTTVTLFEKETPDAQTNKPVCYDCHGVHDIASPNDPQKGLLIRENLLARCQVCHPDATANFPDAWLSHYIPSPQKTPLVYFVNLFYSIFIPGTLGGMAVLVVLDASTLVRKRLRRSKLHLKFWRRDEPGEAMPAPKVEAVPSTDPQPEEQKIPEEGEVAVSQESLDLHETPQIEASPSPEIPDQPEISPDAPQPGEDDEETSNG